MKNRKRRWRIVLAVVGILIILIALSGWLAIRYYDSLLKPVDPGNKEEITLTIPEGATISDIGNLLEDKGVIHKAWAFEFYAKWNHLNQYRSGTFVFNRSMPVETIMNDLETGQNQKMIHVVDVRQGMWFTEIVPQLSKVSGISEQEVLMKLTDPEYIRSHYMKQYPFLTDELFSEGVAYPLEGYLAPGIYKFEEGETSLDQLVRPMLDRTGETINRYQSDIADNRLGSLHDILTMASLIEQEAPRAEDRKRIAGIFYNRLDRNMKLQTDPSVAYGQQRRVKQYTKKDLETDTPYNTYTRKGLTVGPIGSPAVDAIEAVLDPVPSDDLYFFARPNGKIYYSKTYSEHQEVVARYRHEWAEQS